MSDQVFAIVTALLSVILAAVISINIKYSATKKEAIQSLWLLAFKALLVVANFTMVVMLFLYVTSDEPLTRADVFMMIFLSCSITFVAIVLILNMVINLIYDVASLQRKDLTSVVKLSERVETFEDISPSD
ncbi:MAG: hypothetical protein AAGI24_12570 [Pseudomonadota bacterium]